MPVDATLDYADLAEFHGIDETTLTDTQTLAIDAHIDALLASLEAKINRPVKLTTYTETLTVDGEQWGRPLLSHTPLVEIVSLSLNGTIQPGFTAAMWPATTWAFGTVVTITYTAGFDGPNDPLIRGAVLSKAAGFARALIARDSLAAGVAGGGEGLVVPAPAPNIRGFSVEGLNVQYQHSHELAMAELDAAIRELQLVEWTDVEIANIGLGRRRRYVVA